MQQNTVVKTLIVTNIILVTILAIGLVKKYYNTPKEESKQALLCGTYPKSFLSNTPIEGEDCVSISALRITLEDNGELHLGSPR